MLLEHGTDRLNHIHRALRTPRERVEHVTVRPHPGHPEGVADDPVSGRWHTGSKTRQRHRGRAGNTRGEPPEFGGSGKKGRILGMTVKELPAKAVHQEDDPSLPLRQAQNRCATVPHLHDALPFENRRHEVSDRATGRGDQRVSRDGGRPGHGAQRVPELSPVMRCSRAAKANRRLRSSCPSAATDIRTLRSSGSTDPV